MNASKNRPKTFFAIAILLVSLTHAGSEAQATDDPPPGTLPPTPVTVVPGPLLSCKEGMVLVDGQYCPEVTQNCLHWMDPPDAFPRRCAEFASPSVCKSAHRRHIAVCMDRYEFPNRAGAMPPVDLTWYSARNQCQAQGKRLCTQSEWTFACEGEEMRPYPYGNGYVRDPSLCNFNRADYLSPNRAALGNFQTHQSELHRIYQAVPSGSFEQCVSPFGVHDMTGNVDEWVVNESGRPFKSALKGGYWGPVRNACRPATLIHNESFAYYQIGFRCCDNPQVNR